MKFKSFGGHNIDQISQFANLPPHHRESLKIISHILPFRVNNYIINELIDWHNIPDDPLFQLTFPQPGMLSPNQLRRMEEVIKGGGSTQAIRRRAHEIQLELNPNPAMQKQLNVPREGERRLEGLQHKYKETVLFFPKQGQMCAAYCTYCFRWAQFIGLKEERFANKDPQLLFHYIDRHPGVTDVLFTGGDPMSMRTSLIRDYLTPFLNKRPGNLTNIRFGTKFPAFWPFRFTTDDDADDLLRLFEEIIASGYHLAVMSHYTHPTELSTPAAEEALRRIRATGAEVRCQSPLIRHVNDDAQIWRELWKREVALGAVPYYMFIARNTGAKEYFSVPLERAFDIYTEAYRSVSGLARTVKGPCMSTSPGKILIDGYTEIGGKRAMVLKFLQGRNPRWVNKPFLAEDNPQAIWLDDLTPFGKKRFFFEEEMDRLIAQAGALPGPQVVPDENEDENEGDSGAA